MQPPDLLFPDGFLWGSATSACQVEGVARPVHSSPNRLYSECPGPSAFCRKQGFEAEAGFYEKSMEALAGGG